MKETIDLLRRQQDEINEELARLLVERLRLSMRILEIKANNAKPLIDETRESEIIHNTTQAKGYSAEEVTYLTNVFRFLCSEARKAFEQRETC